MAEIPDDVVERALNVILEIKKYKRGDLTLEEYEYAMKELRAAGRVFVEWERDRIYALIEQYLGQEDLLEYLRAASDKLEKNDG